MEVVLEFVVKDVIKASEFYKKYLGFKVDYTEFTPIQWVQLSKENTRIMLVNYDFTKKDINGFKKYSKSTNIYKFMYEDLDEIKEIYDKLKKDKKEIFLDFRKAYLRYEFGVYDEDNNMILITKETLEDLK